ncbi:hypothetical protein JCM1840_005839 [Sporobolomyces johnsonii]
MAPIFHRIGQTVFTEIWPQTVFFTLIAMAICVGCDQTGYSMKVNTIMLSVLSTMLSFALSLRSSSALDRWNAGRAAWTTLSLGSRNLALLFWLHFPTTTLPATELAKLEPDSEEMEVERMKAIVEKKTMIGLIQAYAAAVKHYVRGESGIFYEDLFDLVACLPKYAFPSSIEDPDARSNLNGLWRSPHPNGSTFIPVDTYEPSTRPPLNTFSSTASTAFDLEKGMASEEAFHSHLKMQEPHLKTQELRLAPAFNPPKKGILHYAPVLALFKPIWRLFAHRKPRVKHHASTNIPLEIQMFLSGYIAECMRRKTLEATLVGVTFGYINQLADSLTTMERVLSTPLPFAYNVHLRAVTYIFLLFLPFQVYASLGYLTIVAEFVSGIIFLGFLELGTQLEMPFGYDDSDLDLDSYCSLLAAELREITAHPQPAPSTFVWSSLNRPFLPFDGRTGTEVLAEFSASQASNAATAQAIKGVPGMRKYLAQHYHELEERARREKEKRKKRAARAVGRKRQKDDSDDEHGSVDARTRTIQVCAL